MGKNEMQIEAVLSDFHCVELYVLVIMSIKMTGIWNFPLLFPLLQ